MFQSPEKPWETVANQNNSQSTHPSNINEIPEITDARRLPYSSDYNLSQIPRPPIPNYGLNPMYGSGYNYPNVYTNPSGYYRNTYDPVPYRNQFNNAYSSSMQVVESVVTAITGLAHMIESTYIATQSSFFAIMSVAEHFGNLGQTFGSLFAVLKWFEAIKRIFNLSPSTANKSELAQGLSAQSFRNYKENQQQQNARRSNPVSLKPLLLFVVAIVGLPYLMKRLMKKLYDYEVERQKSIENEDIQVDFVRALADFEPKDLEIEIPLKKGDLVAVLSKNDPFGNPSKWWKGRTKDSKIGWFPSNFCEVVATKQLNLNNSAADQMINEFHSKGSKLPTI